MTKVDNENRKFFQAVSFVNHTNKSLFLTGKAGTGKTTFLKYIKENSQKKLAIIAPTGVAAINAGGTTIHSFFQLPFGTFLPTDEPVWGGEMQQVYNKTQLLRNQRLRQPQRKLIQSLELLIIDEVSMLRSDVLDAVDTILRSVRRRAYEPFGGVQLLFIGDMYQLPPVINQSEMNLMRQNYAGPFFFNAQVMAQTPLLYIELDKIYRQKDLEFIQLLDNVRNNCCQSNDFDLLQERYQPDFSSNSEEGYITLTTHNKKADAINSKELEKIKGKSVSIQAKIDKNFPESAYPVEENLTLKEGAQVMFIKNDKGEDRRFYNGKIGKVSKIDFANKKIQVICEGEADPIDVEIETWKNIKYEYDKEKDKILETELGSFQQYPIRLAWAVTIHKSQGLTFEKAIIDAGQSFAPGQVYVALSRLTNINGLVLHSPISPRNIMTDPRIIEFAGYGLQESEIEDVLFNSQQEFARDLLFKAYDFEDFSEEFRNHSASYYEKAIPDRPQSFAWSESLLPSILKQHATASSFSNSLQGLLQKTEVDYQHLHQRNQAAFSWFREELQTNIIDSIKIQIQKQKDKPRTKSYLVELDDLLKLAERKKYDIEQSLIITEALNNNHNIEEAFNKFKPLELSSMTTSSSVSRKSDKTTAKENVKTKVVKGSSRKASLELFQQGKSIEEIAVLRSMASSTIQGHLISFIQEGLVSIDHFVHAGKVIRIKNAIKDYPTATYTVLKNILGEGFTYTEIQAVMKSEEHFAK